MLTSAGGGHYSVLWSDEQDVLLVQQFVAPDAPPSPLREGAAGRPRSNSMVTHAGGPVGEDDELARAIALSLAMEGTQQTNDSQPGAAPADVPLPPPTIKYTEAKQDLVEEQAAVILSYPDSAIPAKEDNPKPAQSLPAKSVEIDENEAAPKTPEVAADDEEDESEEAMMQKAIALSMAGAAEQTAKDTRQSARTPPSPSTPDIQKRRKIEITPPPVQIPNLPPTPATPAAPPPLLAIVCITGRWSRI